MLLYLKSINKIQMKLDAKINIKRVNIWERACKRLGTLNLSWWFRKCTKSHHVVHRKTKLNKYLYLGTSIWKRLYITGQIRVSFANVLETLLTLILWKFPLPAYTQMNGGFSEGPVADLWVWNSAKIIRTFVLNITGCAMYIHTRVGYWKLIRALGIVCCVYTEAARVLT